MRMDGSVRSDVLKKKSSSGCLIIKKKGESKNSGGGFGGLSGNSSEKKRPRLVASGSSSSDEDESLEFMRRRVNDMRLQNGSMGYKRRDFGNIEHHMDNIRIKNSEEKKRNRLDLFEFDEYDEFDVKKMRNNEYMEDRFKMAGHKVGGNLKGFGLGSSCGNLLVDKKKRDSTLHASVIGRSKEIEYGGKRNKGVDLEEDEAHMPISLLKLKYQGMANEPIRLQGKNGVLKVMVNKKNKKDTSSQHKNYDRREIDKGSCSRLEDTPIKELLQRSPVYPKPLKSLSLFADKEKSVKKERTELKLEKLQPVLKKGKKARDLEVDGTDTVLKLAPPGTQASDSKKGVKKEDGKLLPPENITPVKGKDTKEGTAKRGRSTEKQMLREKIREMLVNAGWSIDYRPRRNRDYLDAVYINPSGTAYWSIIKAYDAFKQQLDEDRYKSKVDSGSPSPSFAPLADDMIHKLTRQTKKKTEEELKRKRKENGLGKSAKRTVGRDTAGSWDSDQNEEKLSSYVKQKLKSRQGKMHDIYRESEDDLSDDSRKRKSKKVRGEKKSVTSNSNVLPGRTSKNIGRCTLLVRGSKGENMESDGYIPYTGKRTLLAWLIDSGTAQLSEKVQYMNRKRTRIMLEGWITRDGIHCGCCSKILTVSKFELHAGSKLRQPFQNIFLESGASLLQCQLDAWNRQEESVRRGLHTVDVDSNDPDDDTCGICGDGGDLICCDSCPSTFHQICLGIQMLPSGDWHCPNCTCKFCGNGGIPEANDSGVDELVRCSFCEKNYHQSCIKKRCVPSTTSNDPSFCGLKCQELYDHLQKNLGVKHELEAGFSWSLIQRMDVSDTSHRGFPQMVESNSKLAVALTVMDECFLPIIDRRSGINIIHNVVYNYGSNFNRLNYHGFYAVILERGDEIISAASIRIHGTRLAEMPLIGTREIYRRQGMCRRLLTAIETELSYLKVERLIIPTISEHMNTWTTEFGFHPLEDVLKKEMKSMNMLVFPGTDMLQKQLVKQEVSDGKKVSESIKNQEKLPVLLEKSDVGSSMKQNRPVNDVPGLGNETKTVKDNDPKFSPPRRAIPSNDKTGASPNSVCTSKEESALGKRQKEHIASLKCPSAPGDNNKITDMENESRVPPYYETNSTMESVVGSAFESETPPLKLVADASHQTRNGTEATRNQEASLESMDVQDMEGVSAKVAEDSVAQMAKSLPGLVIETSAESAVDEHNGSWVASSPTAVVNGGFSEKSNPDLNHAVRLASSDVNASEKCDTSAPCTDENAKGGQLAVCSSLEDSATEVVETVVKEQNPSCNTFSHDEAIPSKGNPELDCNPVRQAINEVSGPAENDNPVKESELPHVTDGNVSSLILISENTSEKVTTTEDHAESSNGVDGNTE